MNVIIIGRTHWLIDTSNLLVQNGHKVIGIITSKAQSEYKVKEDQLNDYALSINAEYIYDPNITSKKLISIFDFNQIDIGISVNYTGLISNDVVKLFKYGILNAHGGDLPRYRGNACQSWAIINGEKKIGLCIHKMIGGELDSGNIIAREYLSIDIDTRIGLVYCFFDKNIPKLFNEALSRLELNENFYLEEQSSNPNDILRCYPRTPEDCRINWEKSNEQILRLINASSEPYQGAFCFFKEKKLTIWRAKLYSSIANWVGIPGHVAEIKPDGSIVVLTGNGMLLVKEIEYCGKRTNPSKIIKSVRSRLS